MSFPVNFAKFFGTPFLQNTYWGIFLNDYEKQVILKEIFFRFCQEKSCLARADSFLQSSLKKTTMIWKYAVTINPLMHN